MNEKEEIINMLEWLKDRSQKIKGDVRTIEVYITKESFDYAMNEAIKYIDEH